MMLQILKDSEIRKIHEVSVRILSEIGVNIPHLDMRNRFREAAAWVDEAKAIVRIPPELVERSIAQAGKTFTLYGRDRSKTAAFGQGQRNYNSSFGQACWIDDQTGQRRYARLADVAAAARLGDALPNLTIVGAMADPHELSPAFRVVEVARTLLHNTTKPIGFWFHDRVSTRYVLEILQVAAGSTEEASRYPLGFPFFEPISPLRFPYNGIDLLYETARLNLPVPIGPMAQVGMSAPGTLVGAIAQENAEILAGICITQLIRPGLPVCYGGIPHAFDMRTTQIIFCGPEQVLISIATTQMGKHYGLPVYINVGMTDSKAVDAQAGLEAGASLLAGAMTGADIFGHLGICGADQGASLDMLLMQHELIGFVERVMQGLRVEEDSFGLDLIKEVGPGGKFIDSEHTARHFRKELWFPCLLDRQFYAAWREGGAPTMAERCRKEKERLLAQHQPEPLPEDVAKELECIVNAARRELA